MIRAVSGLAGAALFAAGLLAFLIGARLELRRARRGLAGGRWGIRWAWFGATALVVSAPAIGSGLWLQEAT